MNSKNTLPISEARKKIFLIAEEVQKPGTHYTLTQKGRPKAVIMSADEFESWQETIEIMSDPKLMEEIRQTKEDFEKGRMDKFITWEEMQKKLGWNLADNSGEKYVSNHFQKKRRKKSRKN